MVILFINLLLFGLNGLVLCGLVRKSEELRLQRLAKKESLYLACNKNWRNR